MEQREAAICQWFDMWLTKRDTGIRDLFAPDAVYIESWGPEYHGADKIAWWFTEWNRRGTVERWDIRQFFHKGDQTVVEWTFANRMDDGRREVFEGMTLVRWTATGQIARLQEFGCNLGQMGCVGFMFTQKGVIVVDLEDKDPDELMMDALDAGADDFDAGEDAAEVTTSPENFTAVCDALEKKGYKFISADVAQVPSTTTVLTDPDQLKAMGKLLDSLEDNDDVQNVWHSLENEEDLPE